MDFERQKTNPRSMENELKLNNTAIKADGILSKEKYL